MARVKAFQRTTAVLATLTPEEQARTREAMVPLAQARAQAERAVMRLQGAKAAMLDAQDAFDAAFAPICAAHGLDPRQPMELREDGTLVPMETEK